MARWLSERHSLLLMSFSTPGLRECSSVFFLLVVLETQYSRAGTSGSSIAPVAPLARAFPCSIRPRRPRSRTSPRRSTSSMGLAQPVATSPKTSFRWQVFRSRTKALVRRVALRSRCNGVADRVTTYTAVVDSVSSGLLTAPVSGLLGLGWQGISSSGEMPFWQTLASSGAMDSALFAVQLRRWDVCSSS